MCDSIMTTCRGKFSTISLHTFLTMAPLVLTLWAEDKSLPIAKSRKKREEEGGGEGRRRRRKGKGQYTNPNVLNVSKIQISSLKNNNNNNKRTFIL